MHGKVDKQSQKLSPVRKRADNLPSVFSPLNFFKVSFFFLHWRKYFRKLSAENSTQSVKH